MGNKTNKVIFHSYQRSQCVSKPYIILCVHVNTWWLLFCFCGPPVSALFTSWNETTTVSDSHSHALIHISFKRIQTDNDTQTREPPLPVLKVWQEPLESLQAFLFSVGRSCLSFPAEDKYRHLFKQKCTQKSDILLYLKAHCKLYLIILRPSWCVFCPLHLLQHKTTDTDREVRAASHWPHVTEWQFVSVYVPTSSVGLGGTSGVSLLSFLSCWILLLLT